MWNAWCQQVKIPSDFNSDTMATKKSKKSSSSSSSSSENKEGGYREGRRKSSLGQTMFDTVRHKCDKMMKRKSKALTRSSSLFFISQKRKEHFKAQSIMGVRSETESDAIAFIHAPDGDSWARFLQNKLSSEAYRIQAFSQRPQQESIPALIASAQTCAVLVTPALLEQECNTFWFRSVENFHHRTVILFLGTNTEDLAQCLGIPLTRRVLSHRWLEVDGSKDAVARALVKLIEAYESAEFSPLETLGSDSAFKDTEDGDSADKSKLFEDDDDIYDYPPAARQQNKVLRIVPTVLYEHSNREVLILTEKDAEESVAMVTDSNSGPSRHISTEQITPTAYVAKLPDNLYGRIKFSVLCGEHNLGNGSVYVHSRMDQLQHILESETGPLSLLCNSLGLPSDATAEEVDSFLAQRLKTCSFPADLMSVLNTEDQTTAESENTHWPTLLHFAAEFNMAKVCAELLRFPGMIHAACMENKEGLFPCQLAEKKGYRDLQKVLVQYVEDTRLRRSAADSGISFSENMPPPARHRSSSFTHYYVNSGVTETEAEGETYDSDYIDMNNPTFSSPREMQTLSTCREITDSEEGLSIEQSDEPRSPPPPVCHARIHDGYAKPRSYSEGCVRTPYSRTPINSKITEEEAESIEPPPLQPKMGRSKSAASEYMSSEFSLPVKRRPESCSSQNSDAKDKEQGENPSSAPASESSAVRRMEKKAEASSEGCGWHLGDGSNSRPASNASSSSSQSEYLEPVTKPPPVFQEESPVLRSKDGKRKMSVQDKISHFFNKIKPSSKRSQSASDGDLPVSTKGHKKPIVYTRCSTVSTSSDPSGYQSTSMRLKSQSSLGESERDSGAVCDEPGSPQRRLSVRVQRVKNEDLSETPTLPPRGSIVESRETFVSFIK